MSKSYDNVIPLFEGGEKALREAIMKIVTDSKLPGEPKDPDSTSLTALYDAFASHEERNEFRKKLQEGLGWGEAKEIVFQKINSEIGPMRERYEAYMQEPEKVEAILREGVEGNSSDGSCACGSVPQRRGLKNFQNRCRKRRLRQRQRRAKLL